MDLDPRTEPPLHPIVLGWLRRYAAAPEEERDAVVAGMLREWNAMLPADVPTGQVGPEHPA